jgi:ribosomal-protein-alanine N-acetyltransferase
MYQIFLTGERLYLRLVEKTDIPTSIEWLNDQETTKWMQNGLYPKTEKEMLAYYNSMQKPNLYLAIILKDGNRYIGNISLKNNSQNGYYSEVSIIIGDKSAWGKGYAPEAISLLAVHCFKRLNIHKLKAGAVVNNTACIRAFVRAGFHVEGTEREAVYSEGKFRDISVLALIRSDMEAFK